MSNDSPPPPSTGTTLTQAEPWVLLAAMVFPSIITYIYFVALADRSATVQQYAGGGLKFLQFALPMAWVVLLGTPVGLMRPTTRGLASALAFGAAVAAAMVLLHRPLLVALGALNVAQNAVEQKVSELGFVSRGRYIGLSAFYTLAHSLLEEYYWRWFVFGRLRKWTSASAANLISSAAFMAHHIIVLSQFFGIAALETWLCSLGVGMGGVVWAWMYNRCDRLFPIWLSHALVDAAIFYIGYRFLFQ